MRKLGFIVEMKSCPDASSLRRWVEFAAQHRIDGIELLVNEETGDSFDADMVAEAFGHLPVEICAIGYWRSNTIDPDAAAREQALMKIRAIMDGAARLNCHLVFFNAGEYMPGDDDQNIRQLQPVYASLEAYAAERGIAVACYLGHGGNFIKSRKTLAQVLSDIPSFNLKVDPVGIMRNLKDDPYDILRLFGDRIAHFHVKDILRYGMDGFEIEPSAGMGELRWNQFLALLYHHSYKGYLVIEPHGPLYAREENRWKHILLSKRHIEQFML